jgi:hypothetical protein
MYRELIPANVFEKCQHPTFAVVASGGVKPPVARCQRIIRSYQGGSHPPLGGARDYRTLLLPQPAMSEIISNTMKMKNSTLNPTHAIVEATPKPNTPNTIASMSNTIDQYNMGSPSLK